MDAAREMAPPAASLSKPKLSVIAKPPSKEKGHTKDQDKPKETETKIQEKDNAQPFVMEKIKPMGKLDFSRAKTKEVKKEVKNEMKAEQAKKVAETSASGAKSRQATEKKRPKEEPKVTMVSDITSWQPLIYY